MLKILIPLLLVLILYFVLRARKGMSAIDTIYGKDNIKNLEEAKIKAQQKLDKNKIRK
tara:strand:+ start:630 stop:803 length:174 start_codon:yes stop_codon:yes gene_type:complete